MTTDIATADRPDGTPRKGRAVRLSARDRIALAIMVTIPVIVVGGLVWFPTFASIGLSFTNWDGIGGITSAQWIGTENYHQVATIYPGFWPAVRHNLIWLAYLTFVATPFGLFLAYQFFDKEMRGSRVYQSIFFLPVVLSFAIIGFIVQLIYSPTQGLINGLFGTTTDWLGDPSINLWAVLVLVGWRHAGYIMMLYLAGLKASIRPCVRPPPSTVQASGTRSAPSSSGAEADQRRHRRHHGHRGASRVRHRLRRQQGAQRLELLSILVTNNIIGEASRVGYGSAIAVILIVLSIIPIVVFVWNSFKETEQA